MAVLESASQVAYNHIRDAILTGAYPVETMLGEIPLSKEIGVSRTPVRTALARLQDEGWVTLYPKRGALVRGVSEADANDLMEARFILESNGVQCSSLESRLEVVDRLESLISEQQSALERSDVPSFIEATVAFHRSFVEVSGNDILIELYDRLADRQRYLLFKSGPRLLERCEDIVAEHRELVKCFSMPDDTERFSDLLRTHFVDTSGRPLRLTCIPFARVS